MRKLILLAAVGLGYVLGAKAGRQRYEDIKSQFLKVKNNPTVQEKAGQAADAAKQQAPVVKDKVVGAAGAAATKTKSSDSDDSDLADQLNPDSTVHQGDDAYPKGDLP